MSKFYYYCEECKQQVSKYYVDNKLHQCGPIVCKEKPKNGYWYKFYITECVLCGAGGEERYRQYSPKPEDVMERYEYNQFVCDYHFM